MRGWGAHMVRRIAGVVALALLGGFVAALPAQAILPVVTFPDSDNAFEIIDGIEYMVVKDDPSVGAAVIGYVPGTGTDVVIPDMVEMGGITYEVTSIEYAAFAGTRLWTVFIPHTVTRIGEGAFAGNSLSRLDIPDSVIEIGAHAFADNALASVTIPRAVKKIDAGAFNGNPKLTEVIFEGDAPELRGTLALGSADPTVWFFSGAQGFTNPWNGGGETAYTTAFVPVEKTVNLDTQGGVGLNDIAVEQGASLEEFPVPRRVNHDFVGWFDAPVGGNEVTFPYTVTEDVTFYAHWTHLEPVFHTPQTVTPGEHLTVYGEHFEPGEEVQIWLLSDPTLLTTVTVGDDGDFSVVVKIPDILMEAAHVIEARGEVTRTLRGEVVNTKPTVLGDDGALPVWIVISIAVLVVAVAVASALIVTRHRHRGGASGDHSTAQSLARRP